MFGYFAILIPSSRGDQKPIIFILQHTLGQEGLMGIISEHLASFIQYYSADDLSVINLRFRYNPRDGNDFYLVFNETLNSNRDRHIPRLPVSYQRAVLVKFNYTFSL